MIDEMVPSSIVFPRESTKDVLPTEPNLVTSDSSSSLVHRQETDIAIEAHDHLHESIHTITQVLVVTLVTQS